MRVLLVAHNFVSEWRGGVEVYTHDFAHALERRGVDVAVLYTAATPDASGAPRVVERVESGLRVFRVETPLTGAYGLQTRNPQIESLFRDVAADFDVVHFQHTWALLPFSVVEEAKRIGARVAVTLHDAWFLCARTHLHVPGTTDVCSGPTSPAKCARCLAREAPGEVSPADLDVIAGHFDVRRAASERALAASDRVTAPSRFLIDRFARAGVTTPIEHEPLGIAPVDAPRQLHPEYVVLAYLGALSGLKNTAALVRAFRATPGAAGLWVFGDGPERQTVAALAAPDPRIEMMGTYDAADLPEILSRTDAVVLPSFVENYPMVLREALSAGVPVLASAVGGIPEIVEHETNGLLFDPTDDASIAHALHRACSEPGLLDRLRGGIRPPKSLDDDAASWAAWYARRDVRVHDRRPTCSVVVPVFNRCDLTAACIDGLRAASNRTDYELIVSDDGSSDGTQALLAGLGDSVRRVRSDANRGFSAACNAGEAEARADLVVFLNNDTIPRDGWLDPLVEEAEGDPRVAVVGSRLLFPDGRVQHAGVSFAKLAGRPYHALSGASGESPQVLRRRELGAVTGACMLVRRHAFRALGGFDTAYRNGFEDIDLCHRVAERGEKIVYRPDSVLVHRESQTPGRRDREDANMRVYDARWGGAWRADEDRVLDRDHLGIRANVVDGVLRPVTFARDTPGAPPNWEVVVDVQVAAAAGDRERVRALLRGGADAWPPDLLALCWGVWMAEWVGDEHVAHRLSQRLERVGVKRPEPETRPASRSTTAFQPVS